MFKKLISENPICFTIIVCFLLIVLLIGYIINAELLINLIIVIFMLNFFGIIIKGFFG